MTSRSASIGFALLMLIAHAAWAGPAIRFEAGARQPGEQTSFLARCNGHAARVKAESVTFFDGSGSIQMTLVGANPSADGIALEPLEGVSHYLVGNDASRWQRDVPGYGRIEYHDVYPGVDVVYRDAAGHLEYDFVVRPGANPAAIRLRFEGAEEIRSGVDGELVVRSGRGEFRHKNLSVFQIRDGQRQAKAGRLAIRGSEEAVFEIEEHDPSVPLVIDPVIAYSTYLGGSGVDVATSIAVDSAGNTYLAGWTETVDLLGIVVPGATKGLTAYVVKSNPAGALIYITYLGGSLEDRALGVAVDGSGSPVLTGWTYSSDFPLANAAQTRPGGVRDAFLAKLNAAGSGFVFSTYLGGSGTDSGNGVALDAQGNIYVTGDTTSSNFPVANALQGQYGGTLDAFVAKYSSAGARQYATYLGGVYEDSSAAITVDASSNVYLTGSTSSPNFPVVDPLQSKLSGSQDAFIVKLNAAGNALVYSTYIGGSGGPLGNPERGVAIAVDSAACAYVTGTTASQDFPLSNPLQSRIVGTSEDAFVLKLAANGKALVYSTYLGGSSSDFPAGLALDTSGAVYVTGYTASADFPVVKAVQSQNAGGYDAFIVKLDSAGSSLQWATYLGGKAADAAAAVAVTANQDVYMAGHSQSTDFPVTNALQVYRPGPISAFISRFSPAAVNAVSVTPSSGNGVSGSFQFAMSDSSGYQDLAAVEVVINGALSAASACYVRFEPQTNRLWLVNDAGTKFVGPAFAGAAGTLSNSQCSLNAASVGAIGSGNTLTLTVPLTFSAAFAGNKIVLLWAVSLSGRTSGYRQLGSWTVPAPARPGVDSAQPSAGSGGSVTFQFAVSDSLGYRDLAAIEVVVSAGFSGAHACYLRYEPLANRLWIVNDAGTQFQGPATPGVPGALSNSQCAVNVGSATASGAGNTLVLTLSVTFAIEFAGNKNVYLWAMSTNGQNSGYQLRGTWRVPGSAAPPTAAVSPASGSGSSGSFQFVVSDSAGYANVSALEVVISNGFSGSHACYFRYERPTNRLWIVNDAGTQFLGPATPGASGALLSNSQCSLNAASATVVGSGDTLTLTAPLAFMTSFSGPKSIYLWAISTAGQTAGYVQRGAWTIP